MLAQTPSIAPQLKQQSIAWSAVFRHHKMEILTLVHHLPILVQQI
jgi:hypothetical protein